MKTPLAYLITFTTYGTWLHGDQRGSVDKEHNTFGSDFVGVNPGLNRKEQLNLRNRPVRLNGIQRQATLKAILGVCHFRGRFAHVVHVGSSHIHVVVSGEHKPEKMMVDFKAYATGAIRADGDKKKYWTWGGSTRYIWTAEQLARAVRYVRDGQVKAPNVSEGS